LCPFTPFDQDGNFELPPGSFGVPLHLESLDSALNEAINRSKYKTSIFVAFFVLAAGMMALVVWSFYQSRDSFGQEMCVVVAAGIATFLGTPLVVKLNSKRRDLAVPGAVAFAFGASAIAVFADNPLRGLLIESSVSVVLIMALEIAFHHLMKSVRERYKEAEAQRIKDEALGRENLEAEKRTFDEKVAEWEAQHEIVGHGLGDVGHEDHAETNPNGGADDARP
jgi:hypothetical protein